MCVGGGGGGESGASKQARADVQKIAVKSAGKKIKRLGSTLPCSQTSKHTTNE